MWYLKYRRPHAKMKQALTPYRREKCRFWGHDDRQYKVVDSEYAADYARNYGMKRRLSQGIRQSQPKFS